jgi:hypothetical protein
VAAAAIAGTEGVPSVEGVPSEEGIALGVIVKACWRICFKISGFKGREKNLAKEIIEAESLSAGNPTEEIREEIERAAVCCGTDGGFLAAFAAFATALCAPALP